MWDRHEVEVTQEEEEEEEEEKEEERRGRRTWGWAEDKVPSTWMGNFMIGL